MPTFAQRVAHLGTTVFTEINDYAAQYDTVNLGQGRPDFDGPPSILQAAANAILSGKANQYAPGFGVPMFREEIAKHAQQYYELDINPNGGVVVTSGAAEGVFSSIMGLVNPGQEVILIEPFFDIYLPIVEFAGGIPVFVPMHPPKWELDPDELRAAFSEKTGAILINTPHNPTGRVFSEEELTLIADLCKEFDVIAITDEVYEHLTYDGAKHIPIATLPDMFERTVTISSGAKTFSATGWKCGWVMGDPKLITGVWRMHQNVTFVINHPAQYGIAHGLTLGTPYYLELKEMYTRKRKILLDALEVAGIKVDYSPDGAFYVMGDYSDVYDGDENSFAKWLIREYGVACIPPTSFFSKEHQYLARNQARFSYCKHDDSLHKAAERFAKLAKG